MRTKLFRNSLDEVIITWEDTINRSHLISVGIRCFYDSISSKTIFKNNWKSKTGISLGTNLSELVSLNGKDFSFFGLGWDYSGEITSWDGGKLENQGIGITLGTKTYDYQSKEYKNILGNSELSSSNPNAKKVNPIVVELYISTTL